MKWIIFFLLLIGLYQLSIGFGQWLDHINGGYLWLSIRGTFNNPGPYGGFLAIILPFAFYIIMNAKILFIKIKKRIFAHILIDTLIGAAWINFIGIIIILPVTFSRSAWWAAIIGCFFVWVRQIDIKAKIKDWYKKYRLWCFLLISVSFVFIITVGLITYHIKKDSADGRLLIWKISLLALKEHWVKGAGQGNFPGVYGQTQAYYFAQEPRKEQEQFLAGAPDYSYNEFLQFGVEYGLIGLIISGGLVTIAFRNLHKTRIWGAGAFAGGLMAFLIFALFSYPLRVFTLCLLSVFIILMSIFLPQRIEDFKKWYYRLILGLFISCMMLSVCYVFGQIGHPVLKKAYECWHELQAYYDTGDFKNLVDDYSLLYPYLSHDAVFLFEYGQCLNRTGYYEKSNEVLEAGARRSSDPMFYNIMGKNYQCLKQYNEAESMFKQAEYRIPHRVYPLYLLMSMYVESGQEDKLMDMVYKIINKKVKFETADTKNIKKEAKRIYQKFVVSCPNAGKN